jgi:hypothetical protein
MIHSLPKPWIYMAMLFICCGFCGTARAAITIPEGWSVTIRNPFSGITATASSEDSDRWPAENAIDGIVTEPEGLWQTAPANPESAWLELRLLEPAHVHGVRIYHQENERYCRSIDYSIACLLRDSWKVMTAVTDNTQPGWREHPFGPIFTDRVRITITRAAHGQRMGLNEVELMLDQEEEAESLKRERLSRPVYCGHIPEIGLISWEADLPGGADISIYTRMTDGGVNEEADWRDWEGPYYNPPARVTGKAGMWIQCGALLTDSARGKAEVREIRLGWPVCIETVAFQGLIVERAQDLDIVVQFGQAMDPDSSLRGLLALPGGREIEMYRGDWGSGHTFWQFDTVTASSVSGIGKLKIGGARTAEGVLAMHATRGFTVGRRPLFDRLEDIAAWMMAHPHKAIFVEGYNQRTILGLYEMTGDEKYLEHVRKWVAWLLEYQKPEGYWPTGYGDVYFADTGSALGLLINYYRHATEEEKTAIMKALNRYYDLLLVRGDSTGRPFIHEDGSMGAGYETDDQGNIEKDLNKPYTISTALTGAEISAAMYYMTGEKKYRDIAVRACDWLLDTMAPDGQLPYYIDDWNPGRKNAEWIWRRWPYDTSAYAGEGFLAAWTWIGDPEFRKSLGERVEPHIEWLLRTQNPDGSWAVKSSPDQLRSHGVINLLLWYHRKIQPDLRIEDAVRQWYMLLLDDSRNAFLRIPGDGIASSLAGRALLDILAPDIDCKRWKDG